MHCKPKAGREKALQKLFVLRAGGKTFGQIAKILNRKGTNVRQDYQRYFAPLHNNTKGERTLRINLTKRGRGCLHADATTSRKHR